MGLVWIFWERLLVKVVRLLLISYWIDCQLCKMYVLNVSAKLGQAGL